MRLVVLESPLAGASQEDLDKNRLYLLAALKDSLDRGESPIASHRIWPGILDDSLPWERERGMLAGWAWYRACDAVVMYCDRGISPGMARGAAHAQKAGKPVEQRWLGGEWERR